MENRRERPDGNAELLQLIKQYPFGRARAEQIVNTISDLNAPILDENGYSTTYLYEATEYNNVEAVQLLLEHGADPTYSDDDNLNIESALYSIQFVFEEMIGQIKQRLEIAKLFFQFGADPQFKTDNYPFLEDVSDELYEFHLYGIKDFLTLDAETEYLLDLYKLTILYNAARYGEPKLTQKADVARVDEYSLLLAPIDGRVFPDIHLIAPGSEDIGVI